MTDQPWYQRTLFVAFLAAAVAFLWTMYGLINELQDWSILWNPPSVAHMILGVIYALVAFGAALGISPAKLLPPKQP